MAGQTSREHSDLSRALGIVVLAERSALGLSREQVEAASGVSYSTIRRIESGERVATVSQVRALAGALGMRGSDLMRLAEERAERPALGAKARAEQVAADVEVADVILRADLQDRSRTGHESVM